MLEPNGPLAEALEDDDPLAEELLYEGGGGVMLALPGDEEELLYEGGGGGAIPVLPDDPVGASGGGGGGGDVAPEDALEGPVVVSEAVTLFTINTPTINSKSIPFSLFLFTIIATLS